MNISLGYACINTHLGGFRSYRLDDLYKETKTIEIKNRIVYNFKHTLDILKWNEEHNIKLYRMTSELVPLATHPEFWEWQQSVNWYWFQDPTIIGLMESIKEYVTKKQHWITFHPGQYTVLNSNKDDVVYKSMKDLEHHYYMMYYLGGRGLVMHVGGVYGNKMKSTQRWINNYNKLPEHIRDFIYLENDDKSYTVREVMNISHETGVKPLIDFHHWRCNPSPNIVNYIQIANEKWKNNMKIHLSSGKTHSKDKSHADFVTKEDFQWIKSVFNEAGYTGNLWIMLESKAKEQSVMKLLKGG